MSQVSDSHPISQAMQWQYGAASQQSDKQPPPEGPTN
jgi:hypothetical protein